MNSASHASPNKITPTCPHFPHSTNTLRGSLTNRVRNLVRQAQMLVPDDRAAVLVPVIARWAVAFARCLKTHLREDGDAGQGEGGTIDRERDRERWR